MKNNNIIIFKNDGVGDFMLITPCLKALKENIENAHITLFCSELTYSIAKNNKHIDRCILMGKKNLIKLLFINFKIFFLTKYKYLFQLDGKNNSFRIAFFVRASVKSTICFVKKKKFLSFNYNVYRPSKILLKLFFNNYVYRDSDYSQNTQGKPIIKYQSLYFKILENLKFNFNNKKSIFFFDNSYQNLYENFNEKNISEKFVLFHFDERWDSFDEKEYHNVIKLMEKIAENNKLLITTGIKNFNLLSILEKKFNTFVFKDGKFDQTVFNMNNKIIMLKNMPLNLLVFFIKESQKNFSAHSGPVVHIGAAFEKETIDIIKKDKNNELDRWIPLVSNYKRINFEILNNDYINNLKDDF